MWIIFGVLGRSVYGNGEYIGHALIGFTFKHNIRVPWDYRI